MKKVLLALLVVLGSLSSLPANAVALALNVPCKTDAGWDGTGQYKPGTSTLYCKGNASTAPGPAATPTQHR